MKSIIDLANLLKRHITCIGADPQLIRLGKESIFLDEFRLEVNFTKIKNTDVAAVLLSYRSLLNNRRELIKYIPQRDLHQICRFVILCAAEQKIAQSFEG